MAMSPLLYQMIIAMLFLLMVGIGATVRASDLKAIRQNPRGIFIGFISQFLWMPLLAFILVSLCSWSVEPDNFIQPSVCREEMFTSEYWWYDLGRGVSDRRASGTTRMSNWIHAEAYPDENGKENNTIGGDNICLGFGTTATKSRCRLNELMTESGVACPANASGMYIHDGNDLLNCREWKELGYIHPGVLEGEPCTYRFDKPGKEALWSITMVLQGCIPGGSTSNLYTYFTRGDVPLSVTMTICSTMAAFFMIPILMLGYTAALGMEGNFMNLGEMVKALALVMATTAIGIAIRRYAPRKYADRTVSVGAITGFVFIFIVIVGGLSDKENQDLLVATPPSVFVCSATIGFMGAIFGYVTARRIFKEPRRQSRAISFETGIQNAPLTLGIVAGVYQLKGKDCVTGLIYSADTSLFQPYSSWYGFEPAPDPDAQTIPLLYGVFISLLSPLFMLFFRVVLKAALEDPLWDDRREHEWLHERDSSAFLEKTIMDHFDTICAAYPDKLALAYKYSFSTSGPWKRRSYRDYHDEVNIFAKAMIHFGLEHRKGVSILSKNCPEWSIADLATSFAGAIPAGLYPTDTPTQIEYIVNHSESQIIFVEDAEQLAKVREVRRKLNEAKKVIVMHRQEIEVKRPWGSKLGSRIGSSLTGFAEVVPVGDCSSVQIYEEDEESWTGKFDEDHVMHWDEVVKMVDGFSPEKHSELEAEQRRRRALIKSTDVHTYIYTSGTTGVPKCVMIDFDSINWITYHVTQKIKLTPDDNFVSYLPLCHIAEKSVALYGPLLSGGSVWFGAPDALRGTLILTVREVCPSVFFGVPRVWEKIREGMLAMRNQPVYFMYCIPTGRWGVRKFQQLSTWAKKKGLQGAYAIQAAGEKGRLGAAMPPRYGLAQELVFANVRQALGFERCRIFISGAAPLALEVSEYFMSLSIYIYEGYGLSETSGVICLNLPGRWKTGTVGKPLGDGELKVAADGELLWKAPCTMLGYYKMPNETAETLVDGYLHTGDIGDKDLDGYYTITDRKKHMIITAGGENIAPAPIEGSLKAIQGISEAMVVGDKQKYLSCLLTLDATSENGEALLKIARQFGVDEKQPKKAYARLINNADFNAWLWSEIELVNAKLPRVKTMKKYTIVPREFIVGVELTGTQKLKHRVVKQKFEEDIAKMYGKDYVCDRRRMTKRLTAHALLGGSDRPSLFSGKVWPDSCTVVALLVANENDRLLLDKSTQLPPSVVLPDDSKYNFAQGGMDVKFKWISQFGMSLHDTMPVFAPAKTKDAFNQFGLKFCQACLLLNDLLSDEVRANVFPKVSSEVRTLKKEGTVKNTVVCLARQIDSSRVKTASNFVFSDVIKSNSKILQRYIGFAKAAKATATVPPRGVILAYLAYASSRSGFAVMVPRDRMSMLPFVQLLEGRGMSEAELAWIRSVRPRLAQGGTIEGDPLAQENIGSFPGMFVRAMTDLRAVLGIQDRSVEQMAEFMYDVEAVPLNREEDLSVIIVCEPKLFNTMAIPNHYEANFCLSPMSVFEPCHFLVYQAAMYRQLQTSVLDRNRDSFELNHTLQTEGATAATRKLYKDAKARIKNESRWWDFMRWPLQVIDWHNNDKASAFVAIVAPADAEGKTPEELVAIASSEGYLDPDEQREFEARRVINEAAKWSEVGMILSTFPKKCRFRITNKSSRHTQHQASWRVSMLSARSLSSSRMGSSIAEMSTASVAESAMSVAESAVSVAESAVSVVESATSVAESLTASVDESLVTSADESLVMSVDESATSVAEMSMASACESDAAPHETKLEEK